MNTAEHTPYEHDIAAALRAAADQVVPEHVNPIGDSHDEARHDQWMCIRYKIRAIAAELEGAGACRLKQDQECKDWANGLKILITFKQRFQQ